MSLCLLSRGLQNCGLSKRGSCFQLSKAMIALLFDSALLRSTCSTSQPQQQKSLWRQLPPSPDPLAERSIPQAATSRRGPNYPSTEDGERRYLWHAAEASKEHRLSSSTSPDHPFDSANTIPADRLCLVCDAHCSSSCAVCDQDFCSTHLYACVDCDNQYCSRCLDDHRADGHWTDSDTAAELTHSRRHNSASRGFPGDMDLSLPPIGINALAVTKSRISVTPELSQVVGHTQRSVTSQRDTLNVVTSLAAFLLHAIRQVLSLSADHRTAKLLSQSVFSEVSQ
jgi:hypothetical protein